MSDENKNTPEEVTQNTPETQATPEAQPAAEQASSGMDKTKKKRLLTAFIAFDVLVVAVVAAIVLMHNAKKDGDSSSAAAPLTKTASCSIPTGSHASGCFI